MTSRVFNFSAGPAAIPVPVLEQARDEMLSLPGVGISVMEISHRSKTFDDILQSAKRRISELLGVPSDYRVLFLQGGSRLQFSMVPMNLMQGSNPLAEYVLTGSWGRKALDEAVKQGTVRAVWDAAETNWDRVPDFSRLDFDPSSSYVHVTSNETIEGVQFPADLSTAKVPLVCDASSDFLSRPVPIEQFGLIYACAQKNAGLAGLTVVIVREDLLDRSHDGLPGYLNYRLHVNADSLYNTPTTFGIYLVDLIAKWLQDQIGGLDQMHALNQRKSRLLYDVIDGSQGFYRGHAHASSRSQMNVTFRLPDEERESRFFQQAAGQGLTNLKGHRSVGGVRASIYNAMPIEGVQQLAQFMQDFAAQNGS